MSTQEELEAGRFVHRAMQYLKSAFPQETKEMDDETLKNKLIDSCQVALEYGFDTEADMMLIVDLLWRLPEDYRNRPEYEWATEIMASEDMDNETKIDSLHNALALLTALQEEDAADPNKTEK
ncbi:MAG: hypothetical protein IJ752_06430 [Alphaproteobacteria bacterium]|nr:hypothetical protein [Alphaproteobacteria bacterium]